MKALLVATCAVGATAQADTPVARPEAFEADRDAPPPGQGELGFDAGGAVGRWAASVQLGYLDRPFRLHTQQLETFPIRRRETLALGGAFAISSSLLVDARFPLIHQVGDRFMGLGDETSLDRFVIGDLGVGVRLRVVSRDTLAVFARGQLTLPTGDDFDFAGEARFTAAWTMIGRFMPIDGLVIAANAGVRFRPAEVMVADQLLGDELTAALGATYELPAWPGLWCEANHMRGTVEVVGVLGNNVAGKRGPSPVEARVGFIGEIRSWLHFAVRAGKGLDDQIGAERFRALFELIYEAE